MSGTIFLAAYILYFRDWEQFLGILWFSFLKLDKNLTVPFFLSWMALGAPHYNQFVFLGDLSWYSHSTSFFKKDSCACVTRYGFEWYGLAPVCSSIYAGFVYQVPRVTSKMSLYLVSTSYRILWSSLFKCLLYEAILRISDFNSARPIQPAYFLWHLVYVDFSTTIHSWTFRLRGVHWVFLRNLW